MESSESPPVRLLLVDDHDVTRTRTADRLRQHDGIDIIADVVTAPDAIRLARELRPDAILVEARRADDGGLDAFRLLHSIDANERPAIIAYLEILNHEDWYAARSAGADDLLLKEMPIDTFARELRRIIDRAHVSPARAHQSKLD